MNCQAAYCTERAVALVEALTCGSAVNMKLCEHHRRVAVKDLDYVMLGFLPGVLDA